MKSQSIRWIGMFAIAAFTLRQFKRISSGAIGGVPTAVARMDAILCGMTIALMSSLLLSALWRIFVKRLERTRVEEQIVTYSDIVFATWDVTNFGFDEDAAYNPALPSGQAIQRVKPRVSDDVVGVYQIEAFERAA